VATIPCGLPEFEEVPMMPRSPFWIAMILASLVSPSAHATNPGGAQPDSVLSTFELGGACIYNVPDGSGERLESTVGAIHVEVISTEGAAITGLTPADFEIDGAPFGRMSDAYFPVRRAYDVIEIEPGLEIGQYRIVGPLLAGGCGELIRMRVRGVVINGGEPEPLCYRSADLIGPGSSEPDGVVNLLDIARFAELFGSPTYEPCGDLNHDGAVDIGDFGRFAIAYLATFPPGAELDVD
jgi:hypothetical protein